MRKLIALSLAVLALAGAVSGSAIAAKKKKPVVQHVEGTVLIPQGGNAAATCVYRAQRALYIAMGEQVNGIFGYTFKVDPKTVGQPFTLEASAGAGFDISFYGELGSDPTADAPANIAYETPGPGGEKGSIPPGLPNGMVCLSEGANASFTYMTGGGH
jgi:hypothetical protein